MKTILAMMLVLCSTQVFATDYVMCSNPMHMTVDKFSSDEYVSLSISRDGTEIELRDGQVRVYSPAIQCYHEDNTKAAKHDK